MRKLITLVLLAVAGLAHAADDSVYRAFGEKAGINVLMKDFVVRLKADAKIGHFFKDTKSEHLVQQLTDQLCKVSGGPCVYEGAPMAESHRDLEIARADFNRLVEVLQDSMDAKGIPFGTQNRMLALLAPMHRDIVTK
jgi:hemoglobin